MAHITFVYFCNYTDDGDDGAGGEQVPQAGEQVQQTE